MAYYMYLSNNGIKMRLYITLWLLLIRVCTLKHTQTIKANSSFMYLFFPLTNSVCVRACVVCTTSTLFFPTHFIWTWIRLVRHCAVYVFGIKVKKRYGGNVYIPPYGIAMLTHTNSLFSQRITPSSSSNEWYAMHGVYSRHTNVVVLLLCVFCWSYTHSLTHSLAFVCTLACLFSLLILTLVFRPHACPLHVWQFPSFCIIV